MGAQEFTLGAGGNCGFCLVDLNSSFRSGLENVIFPCQSRISGEKKHLVLLISQKDYENIKKYKFWDRY